MKKELFITIAILLASFVGYLMFGFASNKENWVDDLESLYPDVHIDTEVENETQFVDRKDGWTEINNPHFSVAFPCSPTLEKRGSNSISQTFSTEPGCFSYEQMSTGNFLFSYGYFDQSLYPNLSLTEIYDNIQEKVAEEMQAESSEYVIEIRDSADDIIDGIPARHSVIVFKYGSENVAYVALTLVVKGDRAYALQAFYKTSEGSVEDLIKEAVERAKFLYSLKLK